MHSTSKQTESDVPANSHKQPGSGVSLRNAWLLLLVLLLASAVFYSVSAWSHPRLNREIWTWLLFAGLILGYVTGYRALRWKPLAPKWVWWGGVALGVAALFIPPFHSTDIYGYINRGWQQLHYGLNPYVFTVDQTPGWEHDPMMTNHWVNNPSPYGFFYLQIARGLCAFGMGDKSLTVFIFKLVNLILHLLTGWLLWMGLKRQASAAALNNETQMTWFQPEMALYLYLWNPLLLVHLIANGHNDIWMGTLLSLAALLALLGQWAWILPILMAATLVKYGSLVIFPFAVLFLIKNKAWKALGLGFVLSLLVFFVSGTSYLADWQQFHLKEISHNAFVSHGSLHSLVFSLLKTLDKTLLPALHNHRDTIRDVLKNVLLLAYGLFYGGLLLKRALGSSSYPPRQWIQDALLVMLGLVCVTSLKFYPWYLGMFFPLIFWLAPNQLMVRFVLLLSVCQLASITLIGQAHMLNFIIMSGLPWLWLLWEWRKKPSSGSPLPNQTNHEVLPGNVSP